MDIDPRPPAIPGGGPEEEPGKFTPGPDGDNPSYNPDNPNNPWRNPPPKPPNDPSPAPKEEPAPEKVPV